MLVRGGLWGACIWRLTVAFVLPPIPRLAIVGPLTVSGISAGADFASQFHVAYSASVSGSAAFAGQAFSCATTRFAGESVVASCGAQAPGTLGPGCVGLPSTGPAPCVGCDPGATLLYDHCKKTPNATAQPALLASLAAQAAAFGFIDPVESFVEGFHKAFAYRGTHDNVYLPGSVNTTIATFAALGVAAADLFFEAAIPTQHAMPSTDPSLPRSSCGVGDPSLPGLENCGYDGAGAMFNYFFADLKQPAAGAAAAPDNLLAFNQTPHEVGVFSGLATTGYIYVPVRCRGGAQPCMLHAAFHGCGGYALEPSVNLTYALHAGYAQWADANDIAILFAQMGGFVERNISTPAKQLLAGCFDGYGESGPAYAWKAGPQMAAVAAMLRAVGGNDWWWRAGAAAAAAPPMAAGLPHWRRHA
jgi:hypothetical protein